MVRYSHASVIPLILNKMIPKKKGTGPVALNPYMCELVQTLSLTSGKHEYGLNVILIAAYVVKMDLIEN